MVRPLLKVLVHRDGKVTYLDLWKEFKKDVPANRFRERTWFGEPPNPQDMGPLAITHLGHHFGEEEIFRKQGSTACVYFAKCNLRCTDCTNDPKWSISSLSSKSLLNRLHDLINDGAEAVSFVSPTLYWQPLLPVLEGLKARHPKVPLIYNCGGYETEEAIMAVSPFIDIFQPDFKAVTADALSSIPLPKDYVQRFHQLMKYYLVGRSIYISQGILKAGVVVRHLLLPNLTDEPIRILRSLSPYRDRIVLNFMTKYYKPDQNRILDLQLTPSALGLAEEFFFLVDGVPFSKRAKEIFHE